MLEWTTSREFLSQKLRVSQMSDVHGSCCSDYCVVFFGDRSIPAQPGCCSLTTFVREGVSRRVDASRHRSQAEKGKRWGFEDLEPNYSRVSILTGTFFLDLLTERTPEHEGHPDLSEIDPDQTAGS